ncbi:hypothetical protein Tco_0462957 [Tanacetum coccineum]
MEIPIHLFRLLLSRKSPLSSNALRGVTYKQQRSNRYLNEAFEMEAVRMWGSGDGLTAICKHERLDTGTMKDERGVVCQNVKSTVGSSKVYKSSRIKEASLFSQDMFCAVRLLKKFDSSCMSKLPSPPNGDQVALTKDEEAIVVDDIYVLCSRFSEIPYSWCVNFLVKDLISWQCKKTGTIDATSTTEAEYVADAIAVGQIRKSIICETVLIYMFHHLHMNLEIQASRSSEGKVVGSKDVLSKDQEIHITPEKSKGSGEAQEEQISPSTLEAAQILTNVASEGFKGSQAPLVNTGSTPSAQVNTAEVNTALHLILVRQKKQEEEAAKEALATEFDYIQARIMQTDFLRKDFNKKERGNILLRIEQSSYMTQLLPTRKFLAEQ